MCVRVLYVINSAYVMYVAVAMKTRPLMTIILLLETQIYNYTERRVWQQL